MESVYTVALGLPWGLRVLRVGRPGGIDRSRVYGGGVQYPSSSSSLDDSESESVMAMSGGGESPKLSD